MRFVWDDANKIYYTAQNSNAMNNHDYYIYSLDLNSNKEQVIIQKKRNNKCYWRCSKK